jgi:hypothetical protein
VSGGWMSTLCSVNTGWHHSKQFPRAALPASLPVVPGGGAALMLHRALLFIVAAHAHGALGVELPLLEASGAATGRIIIAGKFSPGSDGALVQDAGGLSAPVLLLGGPTPHVVETHQASSGKPIAGTAAVGIVPSVSSSMEALCLIQQVGSGATLSCAAFSPPTKAQELVTNMARSESALSGPTRSWSYPRPPRLARQSSPSSL